MRPEDRSFAGTRRFSFALAALLGAIGACTQGGSADVCTTDPNRSTVACAPIDAGVGCLGRDLGYSDDNLYGASCAAPKHGDSSNCATLYVCDVTGGAASWQPEQGF